MAAAEGSYPETLFMDTEHADVHLAGRCRELVSLDASVGDGSTAGITLDLAMAGAELSSLSVVGSNDAGITARSGTLALSDIRVEGSAYSGIKAYRDDMVAGTTLVITDSELLSNTVAGIMIAETGTEVTLRDTLIHDVLPDDRGAFGVSLAAWDAAEVVLEGCEITGRAQAAVAAYDPDTRLTMDDTLVSVEAESDSSGGRGIQITDGAALTAEDCIIEGNTRWGIIAEDEDTRIELDACVVRDTLLIEAGESAGIDVWDGARLDAWGCRIERNGTYGIDVVGTGAEARLVECTIQDNIEGGDLTDGKGLVAFEGGSLEALGCTISRSGVVGVLAQDQSTRITLRDCTVRDTLAGAQCGMGLMAHSGAAMLAEGCTIQDNRYAGVDVWNPGTRVTLDDCIIRGTRADTDRDGGFGAVVQDQATLIARGCDVADNQMVGVIAHDSGTEVVLQRTRVRDTKPAVNGSKGYGVEVSQGAHLIFEHGEVIGNTRMGVGASRPGTEVLLSDVVIQDTLPDTDGYGTGIIVQNGAALRAERCEVARSIGIGVSCSSPGSLAALLDSTVMDTRRLADGDMGFGVQLYEGGTLTADGCRFTGNTKTGILAHGSGTRAVLRDCTISATITANGEQCLLACGLAAQQGAVTEAERLTARDNEGPGLYAYAEGSEIHCTDCELLDNAFAGAACLHAGSLALERCTIAGTQESADIGGGVGLYAATLPGQTPPAIEIVDTTIDDHPVAGVWLADAGSYQLTGNTITGGSGVSHGATTRCGDGVYALRSEAWDGETGLLLEGNSISGNQGAGLFLDDAVASLQSNTWADNDPDLAVQGEACLSIPEDYDEAPEQWICPEWHQPGCELEFILRLHAADIEARMPPPPLAFTATDVPSLRLEPHPAPLLDLSLRRLGNNGPAFTSDHHLAPRDP